MVLCWLHRTSSQSLQFGSLQSPANTDGPRRAAFSKYKLSRVDCTAPIFFKKIIGLKAAENEVCAIKWCPSSDSKGVTILLEWLAIRCRVPPLQEIPSAGNHRSLCGEQLLIARQNKYTLRRTKKRPCQNGKAVAWICVAENRHSLRNSERLPPAAFSPEKLFVLPAPIIGLQNDVALYIVV